jgi:hypothetical protein
MKNKITRVCIVDTVYTLMVYLFYSNEEELAHTFYFFGNSVVKSIRQKFPNHYYFDWSKRNKNILWRFFCFKILGFFRWPFLRKAKIMGHDHLIYSPYIIGKRDYTYIEDSPKIFSIQSNSKEYKRRDIYWSTMNWFKKQCMRFFIGSIVYQSIANNKQCKELILTEDDNATWTVGKEIHIMPLDLVWGGMTSRKKDHITDIYDLSDIAIKPLKEKTHIILTQQFSTDGYISEQEQVKLYKDIIEKYTPDCLVLKPHPRDKIDYRKYFPDVYIFDKIVPMQLLTLLGIRFKKAITVFSTSINSFPYEIEKEWIGSSIHPKLYELWPNMIHNIYEEDTKCLISFG